MNNNITLQDVADLTVGYVGNMTKEYQRNGIPFLRSLNIKPFRIEYTDLKFISSQFNNKIKKSRLSVGDIVIVRTGMPGTCCVIPPQYDGANCSDLVIVHPNKSKVNPYFLAAYIQYSAQKQINSQKVGAIQKHFNISAAKEIVIPLFPSLEEQNIIANIVNTINNKIELNNNIISMLEVTAKTIYDYWFVQFDFPDENGNPYRSSGGEMVWNKQLKREIPAGWIGEQLGKSDKVRFERGFSYTSNDINSGEGIPMINLASISRNQEYIPSGIKYVSGRVSDNCIVKPFEMLIACTDLTRQAEIIGCPIIVPTEYDEYAYSMDLARVVINSAYITESYLFRTLRTKFYHKYIKGFASGTNVIHLDLDGIKWYPMVIPDIEIQKDYEDIHRPIVAKQTELINENKELESLRDWLLPLLMNGQVTVE